MNQETNFELIKAVEARTDLKNPELIPEILELKKLLQIEVSIALMYNVIINKFLFNNKIIILNNIMKEHIKSVDFWETQLKLKDVQHDSPVDMIHSKHFSSMKYKSINTIQKAAAALRRAEVYSLNEYEKISEHHKLNFQSLSYVRNICIDQQRKHIAILDEDLK